jgi:ribosomal protein S18 acetylase RimI-like enzyme
MNTFKVAESAEHFADYRQLALKYVDWMRATYSDHLPLINQYYESLLCELATLPGKFKVPDGCLLLAYDEQRALGAVAYRKLDAESCEMKSMFVDTTVHGSGVGAALAREIIRHAQEVGYQRMKLETGVRQLAAQRLYERLGFQDVEPYYPVSEALRPLARFMELRLPHASAA